MSENLYEEVKPSNQLRVVTPDPEPEPELEPEPKPEIDAADENNNNNGDKDKEPSVSVNESTVDENNNEVGDGAYANMQELEQARRRLIAAQAVRAKYAENWIDGKIFSYFSQLNLFSFQNPV
jgi:hypothetical protein